MPEKVYLRFFLEILVILFVKDSFILSDEKMAMIHFASLFIFNFLYIYLSNSVTTVRGFQVCEIFWIANNNCCILMGTSSL